MYAAKGGLTDEVIKLHAAGANVNFYDPEMLQSTPLHWAANNGHVDTIAKLVELGARSESNLIVHACTFSCTMN